jgi:Subtilase family
MAINTPPPADNAPRPDKGRDHVVQWSPAPEVDKTFTGVDYSVNGKADGLDPYLVWADLSGFAHLRKSPSQVPDNYRPKILPVLIELQDNISAQDLVAALTPPGLQRSQEPAGKGEQSPQLTIPSAYLNGPLAFAGAVLPAQANQAFFQKFKPEALAKFVRRIEIDLPQDAVLALKPLDKDAPPAQGRQPLRGKVVAIIDDGCAFAHPHFVRPVAGAPLFATRVKRLWDMNVRGPQSPVGSPAIFAGMGYPGQYGCDYADSDLNALIAKHTHSGRIDEDNVYAEFAASTLGNVNRLARRAAHGTHVMDLACGPYFVQDTMCTRENAETANPTWEAAQDDASGVQIIFVQLPMRTVQDTSGRNTMTTDVLNAFAYIVSQCADDAQMVVNLSWGALAGPHDGSHVLEQAIDKLIVNQRMLHPMPLPQNRLQVVVPAGNGVQSRTHANFKLRPAQSQTLHWRTEPDDTTESYVEIWLPQMMQVEVTISDPFGNVFPTVVKGDVKNLTNYESKLDPPGSVLGVCYNDGKLNGQQGHCILIALAPTADPDNLRVTAPHGVWKISITNVCTHKGVVDAYVERDDVALGTRRGARQSYFEDVHYDRMAIDDDVQVDLDCANPQAATVRREGVFNNIATGMHTIKAGGVRETDLEIAEYSPHHFYSGRAKRANTATPVHHYATTEESRTLHGLRAAGTRAASTVRLSGTSMAAPQIARDLVNALL